ncbi:MAG: acylneuraminate cytidylyltransferase family protein [Methylococcaceae bacterium]|jgi:CMP-N-acetylneuraminic acid synthetase
MNKPKILAFIPARGGSKRLPSKNIKLLAGKPLIAWTIEAAINTEFDMDVLVSTESPEIADIAQSFGAEVPFLRPAELAQDHSPTFDAIEYSIKRLAGMGREYTNLVLLQPTSPLRQSFHIDEAFRMLAETQAASVVSVSELDHPLEWSMAIAEDYDISGFIQTNLHFLKMRSQELPKRYRLNGAVACGKLQTILDHQSFYLSSGTYAYKMDKQYAADIDDSTDFEYAEFLMQKIKA